jgi:hypothetical protein
MNTERRRQLLFIGWGVVFAAVFKALLPETALGAAAFTLALWAGFYPLATTTSLSIGRYWAILGVALPVVLALNAVAASVPYRAEMTSLIALVAIAMLFAKYVRPPGSATR